MSVTISVTADTAQASQATTQLSANLSAAFGGIQKQLQAMESSTTSTSAKMISGLQGLSQQAIKQHAVQGDLSKSFLQTGQAAQTQVTQFEKLRQQYVKTEQSTGLLTKSVSHLSTTLSAIGVTVGIAGLVQFGKSVVEAGLQMERFERTLTAATGSSRGAADAWKFITTESNRLGQSVEAMVPIFVQLTAATRNTVLEGERTRELFSALAGAGQAVGLSTDAVAGAMLGLTQIISQNAIQLDEFRNQFASRIPGAMLETAKALKTLGVTQTGTIAEMLKGFERGRISVADLTKAVTMGLQEIQRTAPSMANSAEAAFTQLSNAAFQLKADLARSGLLEFLTNMAQTARSMIAQIRSAMGLGGTDFLRQVGEIQGKLAELRQQRQEVVTEAPRSSLESTLRLEGLLGTTQAERLKKLNEEIALQEERLVKVQQVHKAETDAETEKARLTRERNEEQARQDKALADAQAASRQGAQDAAGRARANVGLVQERVNAEKIALEQVQAVREQALEQEHAAALANAEQTKASLVEVERTFALQRVELEKTAQLELADLAERAAIQTRDAKIASIKATDAAARAAATAPGATAEAQVKADTRSAASALELQTVVLAAENAKSEAVKKRTDAEADAAKKTTAIEKGERLEQVKLTEEALKRKADLREKTLQGEADILDAESALVQAQVDGWVLTREEGLAKTQAIEVRALENRRAQMESAFTEEKRQLQKRVDAHEETEDAITAIETRHHLDLQVLDVQRKTQQQTHLNELLEGWREWVKDVQGALGNFLFRWADGQIKSIKDVLLDLKSYFFKIIADMIAYAATKQIIIPIVGAVLGGFGGGTGGVLDTIMQGVGLGNMVAGLAGAGGGGGAGSAGKGLGLTEGVGLLASMRTIAGAFTNGLGSLTDAMINAGSTISTFFGGPALGTGFSGVEVGGAVDIGAGSAAGAALGIGGGLLALGGGIYAALNASNIASKAAFAASAAAGAAAAATAAYGAVTGAALVTAGGTGWTGIGLIVAAVMAVIGVVLDKVIKPEGPSLSVRAGGGFNIGTADGKLQVQGDLGSRVTRREGVDRGLAQQVQQQLEEGITNAVLSIVQTINAVALDPAALAQPTQEALQKALRNLQPLNTANAKKMERDITEQLRFANLAIVGGLLEPVNLAFDQLRDQGDLQEQLDRLPGTTAGLVEIFKKMNQQLDEVAKSENTDVLRQLSSVRNQVENFGNRIAGTAGQIAESIVTGIIDSFTIDVDTELAGQITQFSDLMVSSFRALGVLRSTKATLEQAGLGGGAVGSQIDRLAQATGEAAGRISTQIVSTALGDLSGQLDQVLIQPIRIQATTVNSLFNDSLAALNALWTEWHALENAGIDAGKVQEQFTRLLGGIIESALSVLDNAFTQGSFAEFLGVLVSIPDEVAKLNPKLAELKALGVAFAQVVGPINQAIETMEESMRTTAERVTFTETRMSDLRDAIADAGNAADRALPLYAQLATAIQANGQAQIDSVNEVADAQIKAANEFADAQIKAVNEMADATKKAVNEWADAWTTAINNAADTQIALVNAWADDWTKAVNDAIDQQRTLLALWVEDMTNAVNTWADLANTTAGQLRTVNDILLAEKSPAAQKAELLAEEGRLAAVVAGGGPGASEAMTELIRVEQQLLALAKQSDDLKAQKDALVKLEAIQKYLREQLVKLTGQSDPILAQIAIAVTQRDSLKAIEDFNTKYGQYLTEVQAVYLDLIAKEQAAQTTAINVARDAQLQAVAVTRDFLLQAVDQLATAEIATMNLVRDAQILAINTARDDVVRAIKVDVINQLKDLETALKNLFAGQDVVGGTLHVPVAVRLAQRGAMIELASGGMVPAMLEPREQVFTPPLGKGQQRALGAMNAAFPRFAGGGWTVPGRGSGDTVPMMLPSGSFVLNRNASGAMGYQNGGPVHSRSDGGSPPAVNIHIAKMEVRNDQDIRAIIDGITRQLRREWRSPNDSGPFR